MAHNGIKIITSLHFFLLIFYFSQCVSVIEEGRKTSTQIVKKHKHAIIKTIRTESGDIVDCLSSYKYPLRKNHKIQMKPNWYPERMKKEAIEIGKNETLSQLEIVHCPEGTIPILRTPKSNGQLNHNATTISFLNNVGVKDAYIFIQGRGMYIGLDSFISVWKPLVAYEQDYSGVSSWVQAEGPFNNIEIAGAGWMVNPVAYKDYEPRFTVYWTRDNFQRTGCINDQCIGFIHNKSSIALGAMLNHSTCKNPRSIRITINKDNHGNWCLHYNSDYVGYWPKSLFSETGLGFGASYLAWGGKVFDSGHFQGPTYTEMGSGHFPYEGYPKACYIRNMYVIDGSNEFFPPPLDDLEAQISNRGCYYATVDSTYQLGTHIFVGGDGAKSPYCR